MSRKRGDKVSGRMRNGDTQGPALNKRDIWWTAFRQTVLKPHGIVTLQNAVLDQLPDVLLELSLEMCQDLDRHKEQAIAFRLAVNQGQGFDSSPIFPPHIVPPLGAEQLLSRCMEPMLSEETIPHADISYRTPRFDLPVPQPNLASGFSANAFSKEELELLPDWLNHTGLRNDYKTGEIVSGQAINCPFLFFERTYGQERHEIEFAFDHCAMDGSAGLRGISMLYDKAYPGDDYNRPSSPVVFSCLVDDDIAVLHHHWIDDQGAFLVAPLYTFDLRDVEDFSRFLAWIEAIEQWAIYFLLPDIKEALHALQQAGQEDPAVMPLTEDEQSHDVAKSLCIRSATASPRGNRQGAPLMTTGIMRTRSPRPPQSPFNRPLSPPETKKVRRKPDFPTVSRKTTWTSPTPLSARLASRPKFESAPAVFPHSTHSNDSPLEQNTQISALLAESAQTSRHRRAKSMTQAVLRTSAKLNQPQSGSFAKHQSSASLGRVQTTPNLAFVQGTPPMNGQGQASTPSSLPMTGVSSVSCGFVNDNATSMSSPPEANSALPLKSVLSKKSIPNFRKQRRVPPPGTSDGDLTPPRSSVNFLSKVGASLGMIKQHTLSKRVRTNNSVPATPTPIPDSMPTPAYDRNRFSTPPKQKPTPVLSPSNIWVQHVIHESSMAEEEAARSSEPLPPPPPPPPPPPMIASLPLQSHTSSLLARRFASTSSLPPALSLRPYTDNSYTVSATTVVS